jgi:predicted DNA repair protein MutK
MASGIFAIFDDIAVLLDDTAALTKIAAKKTAGLLGDDLAVNAEKATGFSASRELHVLWAITKGSVLNKIIILPLAFLLSAFLPQLIVPILLLGGAYLSYEGAEKIIEWLFPHAQSTIKKTIQKQLTPEQKDQEEKVKIKAAIRTDFILSIEIVVITLSTVIEYSLPMQIAVVSLIALLATVGVYGLVALLVRMDDAGLYLINKAKTLQGAMAKLTRLTGHQLIAALPYIIRILSVVGTVAMLLVGGGMFVHNIEWIHHLFHMLPSIAAELLVGLIVGVVLVLILHQFKPAAQEESSH